MLEDRHGAKATDKPAEGDNQDDREAVLARAVVEDFRYGKVLDRLLGYERRIENSLYRTMNELRKQRLIREVSEEVARVTWEVSGEQSQLPDAPDEKVCGAHPTGETPYGVTTNGAEKGDESRQTKPVDVGSLEEQRSCAEIQEIGRGRPSYEEPPDGVTTNAVRDEGESCQTKPEEVTGDKWQVTSQEAPEPGASELPTSNVRLQTTDTLCETKPICVSGSEDRGPGAEMQEVGRGRPTHEEPPDGGSTNSPPVESTQHSSIPSFQDSSHTPEPARVESQSCETNPRGGGRLEDRLCETKPIREEFQVGSVKFQADKANCAAPESSDFKLHTSHERMVLRTSLPILHSTGIVLPTSKKGIME
jgi:hypothetical protein